MAWSASTVQHFDTGWIDFTTAFVGPFNVRKCDTVWTWTADIGSTDDPSIVFALMRFNSAVYGLPANSIFRIADTIGSRVIGNATGLFQCRIIPATGGANAFVALDFFGVSGSNNIPKLIASILNGERGLMKDVDVNVATIDLKMLALRFS